MAKPKKEVPSDKKAEEIRGIIRIAGKDVKGQIPLVKALCKIKGVGRRYAAICADITASKMGIEPNVPVGSLTDAQLSEIESIITHPDQYDVPAFLRNRRREYTTGKDVHLISSDLDFAVKQDIDRDIKTRTWRGISHMYRKKVRGQRTRTSGRKGGTVGVIRKKAEPGKAQPASGAKPAAGSKK